MQGKLATVMRRTVKGGGGGGKGSAAGTAGQPSNITWYGPGKRPVGPWYLCLSRQPVSFTIRMLFLIMLNPTSAVHVLMLARLQRDQSSLDPSADGLFQNT